VSAELKFVDVTEATAKVPVGEGRRPFNVIANAAVRETMDAAVLRQAANIATAPGVSEFVLNPDAHLGYGCPVGSVFATQDVIYPCAVGPDVKCSMSFLQTDVPAEALTDKGLRRALILALAERIPTGAGNRRAPKARRVDQSLLREVAVHGAASKRVMDELGIPLAWYDLCEDASHGRPEDLERRLAEVGARTQLVYGKLEQIGGVGGGNHFMEAGVVEVRPGMESVAETFGIMNGHIGFLNHFGSRGFGFMLTSGAKGWPGQFKVLAEKFKQWHIPFPGGDAHNVYVPVDSPQGAEYLADMYLGANFATVNHLLVCTYVAEAFREVLGAGVKADLVYYIAHNIIRREIVDGTPAWVHRKGATRALPGGHHELKGTRFEKTGHPILLPGNSVNGATIMVGHKASRLALNSVNHGAGRIMSRTKARQAFDQKAVNALLDNADVLYNSRNYPVDESPLAYKDYGQVIDSVETAGLASTVAKLRPVVNIKDDDTSPENSA
jgi:tRNA-splicing ligase RtcB (3'-phosphate/5'-hydroxy nucleic acid ligase)